MPFQNRIQWRQLALGFVWLTLALTVRGCFGKSDRSAAQISEPKSVPSSLPDSLSKTGLTAPGIESPSDSKIPLPAQPPNQPPSKPVEPAPFYDIFLFPPAYDFERVKPGTKTSVQIEVVRPMAMPLKLGRLYSNCPCVTVSSPSSDYQANETAFVNISYDTTGVEGIKNDVVIIQVLEPSPAILRFNIYINVMDEEQQQRKAE